jgi:hypothetical protein
MERYLLPIFLVNWLLVIVDAAFGYHLAPLMVQRTGGAAGTVKGLRRLLAAMVALYMFFSCLAYFRGHTVFLLVVTGLLLLDLGGQFYLRWRFRRKGGDDGNR